MRTMLIIIGGLLLLGVFMGIGRVVGSGRPRAYGVSFALFAAAWTILAAANMWVGISRAGYSFMEELPIFLVIVLVPVACGYSLQRRLGDGAGTGSDA